MMCRVVRSCVVLRCEGASFGGDFVEDRAVGGASVLKYVFTVFTEFDIRFGAVCAFVY